MLDVFEQPWTLLFGAVVVLAVVLVVRSILPLKRHWWQWCLPLLIAIAAFGLDMLVQTDTEKIKSLIFAVTKAVEKENADAVEQLISDDYRDSYHSTKAELMLRCRRRLSEPLVEKNITRIAAIDVQGTGATAVFTVRIIFDKRSYVYDFKPLMLVKVKLDLQKQPDQRWLIGRAELLEIDLRPANWSDVAQADW